MTAHILCLPAQIGCAKRRTLVAALHHCTLLRDSRRAPSFQAGIDTTDISADTHFEAFALLGFRSRRFSAGNIKPNSGFSTILSHFQAGRRLNACALLIRCFVSFLKLLLASLSFVDLLTLALDGRQGGIGGLAGHFTCVHVTTHILCLPHFTLAFTKRTCGPCFRGFSKTLVLKHVTRPALRAFHHSPNTGHAKLTLAIV